MTAEDVLRAAGPMATSTVSPLRMAQIESVTRPARLLAPEHASGVYRQRQFVDPADAGYGLVY